MHIIFINELVLTFTNKLVRGINAKTHVNITVGVFGHVRKHFCC